MGRHAASILATLLLLRPTPASAVPWPAGTGISTSITGAGEDLSGAVWNPSDGPYGALWVVIQDAVVWKYEYNSGTGVFDNTVVQSLPFSVGDDIEGLAQVDFAATGELYAMNEDTGVLHRVSGISAFSSGTVLASWNFVAGGMDPETSGKGPEAVEFAPDANLLSAGFRFPNGNAFTGSTKGMGGLIFVGHQYGGKLWVFDVNPTTSNDFVNHGYFLTAAPEIAGLHYDRSESLMYLWHNYKPSGQPHQNSLEVSKLSSDTLLGTLDVLTLYDSGMPSGNQEGLAIVGMAQCGQLGAAAGERLLWLTLDGDDNGQPTLHHHDEFPCGYPTPAPTPAPTETPAPTPDCAGATETSCSDCAAVSGCFWCNQLGMTNTSIGMCIPFGVPASCTPMNPPCGGGIVDKFSSFREMYDHYIRLYSVDVVSLGEAKRQYARFQSLQAAHAEARLALDKDAERIKKRLAKKDEKKGTTCVEKYDEMQIHHFRSQEVLDQSVTDLLTKVQSTCLEDRIEEFNDDLAAISELFEKHTSHAHKLDNFVFTGKEWRKCRVNTGTKFDELSKEHDRARYDLDESIAKLLAMHAKAC